MTHDAAGDIEFDGRNNYLYDAEGRVCAVSSSLISAEYLYDATGAPANRSSFVGWSDGNLVAVGSTSSPSCNPSSDGFSITNSYVRGLSGEQVSETNGAGHWYHTNVFANGYLLATYGASETYFALNDWLGTRRAEVTPDGDLTTFASLPFGNDLTTATIVGNQPDATEQHYTGKEHDSRSGNETFKYRDYASSVGRWLTPDPSGLTYADPTDPQSLNLYSYVGNRPLTVVDLMGLCWRGFSWACKALNEAGHFVVSAKNKILYGKWTTNTDMAVAHSLDQQEAKDRYADYLKETGGKENLVHYAVCVTLSPIIATAQGLHSTIGVGLGGNAGVGFILGVAADGGAQIVADKHGNVGLAITLGGNPGWGVFGAGAMWGGQASASTDDSIYDLRGRSTDFGVSSALPPPLPPAAGSLDVAISGSDATATATVGTGVGGKAAAFTENYTFLPLSTNCR